MAETSLFNRSRVSVECCIYSFTALPILPAGRHCRFSASEHWALSPATFALPQPGKPSQQLSGQGSHFSGSQFRTPASAALSTFTAFTDTLAACFEQHTLSALAGASFAVEPNLRKVNTLFSETGLQEACPKLLLVAKNRKKANK